MALVQNYVRGQSRAITCIGSDIDGNLFNLLH